MKMTALEFWRKINEALHIRQEDGRDNQLYNELKLKVTNKTVSCGIKKYLENNPQIEAIDLVRALMSITEPFSQMYKDIYRIMRSHMAKKANESIKIKCDDKELDIDLEHFKEYERILIKVMKNIQIRKWKWADLNEIGPFLNYISGKSLDHTKINISKELTLSEPHKDTPPVLLPYIHEIRSVLSAYLEQYGDDPDYRNRLTIPISLYGSFCLSGKFINVDKAIRQYSVFFEQIEKNEMKSEILIEDIIAFLNLPFWKNRWYIYEVWATLLVVDELKDFNIQLNINSEGLLPLKSGSPSKVAEFKDQFEVVYTLYAQVQTNVENIQGRRGIEPDLRINLGENCSDENTKIIIEFKQRLKMSKSDIEANVHLYEKGAKSSVKNIFINYDAFPLIRSFTKTALLSNVRPNHKEELVNVLKESLELAHIKAGSICEYDAILLDVSSSMNNMINEEFLYAIKIKEKEWGNALRFYFSDRLIKVNDTSFASFFEKATYNGCTQISRVLEQLIDEYSTIKRILIITDKEYPQSEINMLRNYFTILEEKLPNEIVMSLHTFKA